MSATTPRADTSPEMAAYVVAVAEHGDRTAFAALFRHFAPRVKAYLLRLGVEPRMAEDLTQETMLTVWRKAPLYDPARADPATWVFTVARNLRIDALRRERHPEVSDEVLADIEDDRPGAEQSLALGQREERVRKALGALPKEQLDVVHLSFFDDKPHSEIARSLGIPLGTVKSRVRLALRRVRSMLEDEVP